MIADCHAFECDIGEQCIHQSLIRFTGVALLIRTLCKYHDVGKPSCCLRSDARKLLTIVVVLCSAVDTTIPACGRAVVSTDLSIAIPSGTYARIAPRSGLAVKHFIDTGAGVVDEDYRGAVGVVLFNHGEADYQGGLPKALSATSDSLLPRAGA